MKEHSNGEKAVIVRKTTQMKMLEMYINGKISKKELERAFK